MAGNGLGFAFDASRFWCKDGHSRLDVWLHAGAGNRWFDPKAVRFPVAGVDGAIGHVTVTHPWPGPTELRVCAGRIFLVDRRGLRVEAFSAGGDLRIGSDLDETWCAYTAPAPIIELAGAQSDATLLASELEALLAIRRAQWGADDAGFQRRLAGVEPRSLFIAELARLERSLEHAPGATQHDDTVVQTLQAVHDAIQGAKAAGYWPVHPPELDEIL